MVRAFAVASLVVALLLVPITAPAQQAAQSDLIKIFSQVWTADAIARDPALTQWGQAFYKTTIDAERTNGIAMAPPLPSPPPYQSIGEGGAAIGFFSTSQPVIVRGSHLIPAGVYVIVLRHVRGEWQLEYRGGQSVYYVGTTRPQPSAASPAGPRVYWTSTGPCETWDSVTFC